MDIQALTAFFMWCSIINGSLLTLWVCLFMFAPALIYRSQKKWFPLSKENFNLIFYSFLGLFKMLFLVFNLVPYLALLLMAK